MLATGVCVWSDVWMWTRREEYVRIVAGVILYLLPTPIGKRWEFMYVYKPVVPEISAFKQTDELFSLIILTQLDPALTWNSPLTNALLKLGRTYQNLKSDQPVARFISGSSKFRWAFEYQIPRFNSKSSAMQDVGAVDNTDGIRTHINCLEVYICRGFSVDSRY